MRQYDETSDVLNHFLNCLACFFAAFRVKFIPIACTMPPAGESSMVEHRMWKGASNLFIHNRVLEAFRGITSGSASWNIYLFEYHTAFYEASTFLEQKAFLKPNLALIYHGGPSNNHISLEEAVVCDKLSLTKYERTSMPACGCILKLVRRYYEYELINLIHQMNFSAFFSKNMLQSLFGHGVRVTIGGAKHGGQHHLGRMSL